MKNEIELCLNVIAETDLAFLLSDGDVQAWVPKSQIEIEEDYGPGDTGIFIMPEWLAEKKEFV